MDEHNELISLIFKWVSNNQDINNTFIFIDDLTFDFDRPPKIGNSIPDFYAKNLKSGFEAIGEAKPAYDIYSERTEKQFSDYFRYLKRINAHLRNIISSVINPYDRIGYKPKSKK